MTAEERLALINAKAERAGEHFYYLNAEIDAFWKSKPYEIATKRDPETRRLTYYLAKAQPVPIRFGLLTGDAIQNLRSALDHLVWQMVLAAGNVPGRHTAFPVYDDTVPAKGPRGQIAGITAKAQQAVDALNPYKTGNPALWMLDQLNNIDKHRTIFTPFGRYGSVDIWPDLKKTLMESGFSDFDFSLPLIPAKTFDPIKAGDDLYTSLPDAEEQKDMQFRFEIAISEPGIVEGEPLIATLNNLGDTVKHILTELSRFLH